MLRRKSDSLLRIYGYPVPSTELQQSLSVQSFPLKFIFKQPGNKQKLMAFPFHIFMQIRALGLGSSHFPAAVPTHGSLSHSSSQPGILPDSGFVLRLGGRAASAGNWAEPGGAGGQGK